MDVFNFQFPMFPPPLAPKALAKSCQDFVARAGPALRGWAENAILNLSKFVPPSVQVCLARKSPTVLAAHEVRRKEFHAMATLLFIHPSVQQRCPFKAMVIQGQSNHNMIHVSHHHYQYRNQEAGKSNFQILFVYHGGVLCKAGHIGR